ncbi:hypothetical protein [Rhizobium sp. AAP43]|uniref:hypothetical protein n=1 Tax=Rhizobium sp. AAP43 TaxID=1523420 RepID=UPI0006B98252|nr:hypothetical protein [Rhizobium sp. AAP43]KPF43147.1 hypothetical protein IP76_15415 [Rhizobium sp. AAP43]
MTLNRSMKSLLAGAAIIGFASPALALDGQDLLAKINASYAAGGGTLSAESIEVDGSDVTMKNVKFSVGAAGTPGETPLTLSELSLQGVSEEEGGAYLIEKVEFPEVDFKEDKTSISVTELYLSGVYIPGDPNAEGLDSMMFYDEAHSGPIDITIDGKSVFSMTEAVATMGLSEDESTMTFEASATGLKADLSTIEDPKAKEAVEALQLTTLDGSLNMSGSWEVESGTIEVDDYSIDFSNVGKLSLAFSMSGYTLDLVKQLQEQARTMQGQPQDEQAQQAAGLAMLGLVQQMTLVNAKIRFEDAGITKRGFDYAGKTQGTDGNQMAQMVKGMVPLLLAQANLGALQNEITAAVNSYVDDPKALTIVAAPASPVAFPMIMGAAMGAPDSIPTLIGLKVTAND